MEPQVQRVDLRGGRVREGRAGCDSREGRDGRRTARGAAVLACAVLAVTAGTGVAQASPASSSGAARPVVEVTHRTVRIGDGDNQLLVFVNKSRAELCTPQRIAYENALEEWFDGGLVGDPPVEPADSNAGVKPVVVTTTSKPEGTTTTVEGDDLPVEVWRFDNEPGGVDCTATDGPGAERFATGAMDFDVRNVETPSTFSNVVRLAGTVRDAAGTRWSYSIRYDTRAVGGQDPVFTSQIRLKPKH